MLFVAVLVVIILCGAEIDLFVPSFPELMDVFNLSPFEVQLTLSANFVSQCVASFYAGTFGDIFGRRRVILFGLVIFLMGSVLCVLSPTYSIMIIGRILQGFGTAAPAVLGYVIIADRTPMEKQASVLCVMNGIITIAMAGAPVIGSFVTKYYGWRGNFMALLILCLVGIIMTLAFIPHDDIKSKEKASLSLKGYLPLLKSGRFMNILMAVTILTTTFWTFIGISPILYMKNMNISIDHFGFYQGANCAFFAIVSLASPKIMAYFTHHTCLRMGGWNALFMACVIFLVGVFVQDNPLIITTVMVLFFLSEVFPINILYPISLNVVEGAKARASGLYNVARLCFSAIGVETVGYFYTGTFFPMALYTLISASIAFILLTRTLEWKEIRFDKNGG